MAKAGFFFDDSTTWVIDGLQSVFGVGSREAVIQRALLLAQLAAKNADADHNILIGPGTADNINALMKIDLRK